MIREIRENELKGLLTLYTELHENQFPEVTDKITRLWNRMMDDSDHHIIVAIEDSRIVASCVCVIIPNLTHEQRPYAFVENVITSETYRGRGLATQCLNYAREIAKKENCYKIMLLTGSKKESTLNFYRQAGYNSEDKTAFIQWL